MVDTESLTSPLQADMDLSIVVPLFNEEESLPELMSWIDRVLENRSFEVVFVDDGSTDDSWKVVQGLKRSYGDKVRGICFSRNHGKSAALHSGFKVVRGKVVITMDADLQDSPDEIPALERRILDDGLDLVSGWKKKRFDPITKTVPTKLYNWATRRVSGIHLNDFNCGLKAYRREVVRAVEVNGEMHRYIPVLAKQAGFSKIGEQVVQHRARKYGSTKFGLERFVNGFLDLLTIAFIGRFGNKPMHLFGVVGTLMFLLGFGLFAGIGSYKILALAQDLPAKNIADISAFYLALVFMMMGLQLFLSGFLAELITRNAPERNNYLLKDNI
jgi:glycosyltransferase involved in cell wall biosynthesis